MGMAMPFSVPAGMVVVVVVTEISVLMRMAVVHKLPPRLIVLLYVDLADLVHHAGQTLDHWVWTREPVGKGNDRTTLCSHPGWQFCNFAV